MLVLQMFARDRRGDLVGVLFACVVLDACAVGPDSRSVSSAPPQDTRAVTVVAFGDMP
jgi:hypothetical protein